MIWFGSDEYMTWVKTPNSGIGRDVEKWQSSGVYLNGGGYSVTSSTGHTKPELTWSFLTSEQASTIRQFRVGAHGQGPFFWIDPLAAGVNVLPPFWSAPRLAVDDAPPLVMGKRPTLVTVPSNSLNLPSRGGMYDLMATDEFATVKVPVPPGYTLHFGWFGSESGTAHVTLNTANVTPLGVSDTARTNSTVDGGSTGSWGEITVTGVGTLTLYGMQALVLPTGSAVSAGGFRIGEGHSGCVFESLTDVGYSAPSAIDYQSVTATFREVGAWR